MEISEVEEVRKILGKKSENLSDEQIEELINKIDLMLDSWMEVYEKQIFDGETLNGII